MKMSENGKHLLAQWEGVEYEVYKDSADLATIGVGHLITKTELKSGTIELNGVEVPYSERFNEQQVMDLLEKDLVRFNKAVNKKVTVDLNQNQFDALISFAFNVGNGNFKSSTLLKLLNKGQYEEVPAQFRRWNKAGGRVVEGLKNRREKEITLWLA
ncbi:MAG: lysozyme [Mariprofundales bacterium]